MQQYPGNQPSQTPPPLSSYTGPYAPGSNMPPLPPEPPRKSRRRLWIIIAAVVLVFVVIGSINAAISGGNGVGNNTSATPTAASSQATSAPTQPAPTPQVHYPPKTKADLLGLAAKGDASVIHEFHSESVGLTGACPQPKREVTVDPSITGQQLAEDLLAYFYSNQLNSPCGSIVFAYHTQAEANDVYTAGRINFDATDSSGQANVDPNATNLKYTLTLDTGGDLTGQQEYVVNYTS